MTPKDTLIGSILNQNFHVQTLLGMSVLGGAMNGDGAAMAGFLSGQHDRAVRCFLWFKETGSQASCDGDLDNETVEKGLTRLKDFVRARVQGAIDAALAQDAASMPPDRSRSEVRPALEAMAAQMKDAKRPHAMGTVDEMAKRLGISKSEVRRCKSNGTLEGMLAQV